MTDNITTSDLSMMFLRNGLDWTSLSKSKRGFANNSPCRADAVCPFVVNSNGLFAVVESSLGPRLELQIMS